MVSRYVAVCRGPVVNRVNESGHGDVRRRVDRTKRRGSSSGRENRLQTGVACERPTAPAVSSVRQPMRLESCARSPLAPRSSGKPITQRSSGYVRRREIGCREDSRNQIDHAAARCTNLHCLWARMLEPLVALSLSGAGGGRRLSSRHMLCFAFM